MAIIRWNPTNDLAGLHSAMDRLFSDVFGEMYASTERGAGGKQTERPTFHLPVNIEETENGYRIQAPVPGFKPDDVEVTFDEGVLTIDARRTEEKRTEKENLVRREVAFGNYRRQIPLPGDVRADDITASFENGVLTIEVPRARKPQPKRIQIQGGEKQGKQLAGAGSRKS